MFLPVRALWVGGFVVLCSACDSKMPTAPLAVANIVSMGSAFTNCDTVLCTLTMPLRNDGPGCGNAVKGTITFFNAHEQAIGGGPWRLTATTIVRSGESFEASELFASAYQLATTSRVDPVWTNVKCP